MPAWIPLSAAAAVAMGGAWWHHQGKKEATELAYHAVEMPSVTNSTPLGSVRGEEREQPQAAGEGETFRAKVIPPGNDIIAAESLKVDRMGDSPAVADELDDMADVGLASAVEAEETSDYDQVVPEPAPESAPKPSVGNVNESLRMDMPLAPKTPVPAPRPSVPAPGGTPTPAEAPTFGRDAAVRRGNSLTLGKPNSNSTGDQARISGGFVSPEEKKNLVGRGTSMIVPPSDSGGGGGAPFSRDRYDQLVDQPWKSSLEAPLSTFSIDVDTASYTNLRRAIAEGRSVQPDSVRIEECINYFDYRYPAPGGDRPFAAHTALATCPWAPQHLLARVAIKGREVEKNARPASNLIFLIDVSGSMQSADKLQLLKRSMKMLVKELDERDRVGIVVYAGTEGVVLPPTLLDKDGKQQALSAISKLESGGSTNGGAGIQRAYQMALNHKRDGGVNRVILATDGDFNVGVTGQGELVKMVQKRAAKGVYLTVLGFGTGNLNDALMEQVSNDGNGNYFYIDSNREAKRVLMNKLSGTLVTIAKDVKIQVEFNPGKVKAYRLIGYANRILKDRDFNDDKVDAGEIGAGHTVTAYYEIVPDGVDLPNTGEVDKLRYQRKASAEPESEEVELVESDDWFTLKLRYKHPDGDKSKLIERPVRGVAVQVSEADKDFQMGAAVAMFGMKLRNFDELADFSWDQIAEIARPALADDPTEQRSEFVKMLKSMND